MRVRYHSCIFIHEDLEYHLKFLDTWPRHLFSKGRLLLFLILVALDENSILNINININIIIIIIE
jgi:hypothetical protein